MAIDSIVRGAFPELDLKEIQSVSLPRRKEIAKLNLITSFVHDMVSDSLHGRELSPSDFKSPKGGISRERAYDLLMVYYPKKKEDRISAENFLRWQGDIRVEKGILKNVAERAYWIAINWMKGFHMDALERSEKEEPSLKELEQEIEDWPLSKEKVEKQPVTEEVANVWSSVLTVLSSPIEVMCFSVARRAGLSSIDGPAGIILSPEELQRKMECAIL